MKKVIIVLLILVALMAGTVYGLKAMGFTFAREHETQYEQFNLGEFTVNLCDEPRRYLRTQIVIEYVYDKESEQNLMQQEAKYRDTVINVLRSKSLEELEDVENIENTRKQLLSQLENVLGMEKKIVDLWFVDFIFQ